MADRGIIFSAPMVRALLDGRKTQTRRLLRNPEFYGCPTGDCPHCRQAECDAAMAALTPKEKGCAPGDRLWVREGWYTWGAFDDLKPSELTGREGVSYEVDRDANQPRPGRFRSARFMPRWASRLWLSVTDVRVQRVKSITGRDAVAEGVGSRLPDAGIAQQQFADLWNSLHAKPGERWHEDPWVVAVSFDVRRGNIDA